MADHDCAQTERLRLMEASLQNGKTDFRDLRIDIKTLLEQNAKLREDIATLKEKARNWGAMFGAAAALVVNIMIAIIKASL